MMARRSAPVNRARIRLCAVLTLASCHLGRPPPATGGFSPGAVSMQADEPSLPEALRAGLGRALAARGALGTAAPIDIEVLDASVAPVAANPGGQQIYMARLQVAFQVTGPRPRRLVLEGERGYVLLASDSLGSAAARAGAFSALARQLGADAADWAAAAPPAAPPAAEPR